MSTANEAPQQSAALERQLPIEDSATPKNWPTRSACHHPMDETSEGYMRRSGSQRLRSGVLREESQRPVFGGHARRGDGSESRQKASWKRSGRARRTGLVCDANKMLEIMHKNGVNPNLPKETAEECELFRRHPAGMSHTPPHLSIEEARNAGLVKDSNWDKWPKAMNRSRAISIGWRAINGTFGIAGANVYTPDEIQDIEATEPQGRVPSRPQLRLRPVPSQKPPKLRLWMSKRSPSSTALDRL